MTDYIRLPCSALEQIHSALHRGIFLSLLERADDNGQLTISVRGFAEEMGVSYQIMRTAIAKLSDNAIINAISTQRLTQITICNYDGYTTPIRKQQRKINATTNAITNQSTTHRFTPPTDAEVAAYVTEKGYHFNPAQFVPHYQSKGWKVGKEPMKDWRAACRTWENSWKEKHGERFYYEIQPVNTTDTPTSRKASRDRMLGFANSIVSQSASKLARLYNGGVKDSDNR